MPGKEIVRPCACGGVNVAGVCVRGAIVVAIFSAAFLSVWFAWGPK